MSKFTTSVELNHSSLRIPAFDIPVNRIVAGTAIIGLLAPDAIYVAVDSLARNIEDGSAFASRKIRRLESTPFHFAVCGFIWTRNGTDLIFQCYEQAFCTESHSNPHARLKRFEELCFHFGTELLKLYPSGDIGGEIRIVLGSRAISTLIFGAYNGQIVGWITYISFEQKDGEWIPQIESVEVKQHHELPVLIYLGHADKAYELTNGKERQEELYKKGGLGTVAYLLAMQSRHSPDFVGPPFVVLKVDNAGNEDAFTPTMEQALA